MPDPATEPLTESDLAPFNAHHIYVSTYCQHGLHHHCRLMCKICDDPCRCECHA